MINLKKYKIQDESFEDDSNQVDNASSVIQKTDTYDNNNNKQNPNTYKQSHNYLIDDSESKIHYQDTSLLVGKDNNTHMDNRTGGNNKTNIHNESLNLNLENEIQNNESNFHHVQIIDEDVENFKRRLDILVKNFRTDTLKDFMGIKRHLLTEQKSIIDSEKQKCDAMLSSKVDQIEHLKENLAKTKHALSNESEIKDRLGLYLYKLKSNKYNIKLKNKAFFGLKNYFMKKKKANKVYIYI